MLAGIPVAPDLVRELADLVDEPTATLFERALGTEVKILALTIEDRERILRALDDPPVGLAELRGVLLREHTWRVREGSSSRRWAGLFARDKRHRLATRQLSIGGMRCMQ
ncbi:MAG: hypothetical protein M3546_17215 [Actinomycetota bacterium]|nr:hypothetical protein [Actinomycetota bacterium]